MSVELVDQFQFKLFLHCLIHQWQEQDVLGGVIYHVF